MTTSKYDFGIKWLHKYPFILSLIKHMVFSKKKKKKKTLRAEEDKYGLQYQTISIIISMLEILFGHLNVRTINM